MTSKKIEQGIIDFIASWIETQVAEAQEPFHQTLASRLVFAVVRNKNATLERRQLLNLLVAVARQEQEEEKQDTQPGETECLETLNGQAIQQVDAAVTQELLSTPSGLKALRLWRSTDWFRVAYEWKQAGNLISEDSTTAVLCEFRWVQIQLELDECFELDRAERERALELLEQYVDKQVMA